MPKTFDEIIARFDDDHAYDGDDVIEALKETRDAIASDPSEWWVNDANDNHVYLGDMVDVGHGDAYEVLGFRRNATRTISLQTIDGQVYSPYDVCKVIPDTREKIIEDAMARFEYCIIPAITREAIEQAVDRAMKLGDDDGR